MAKRYAFNLTNEAGQTVRWTVWRDPRVFCCGGNLERTYTGPLWSLRRHDGYEQGLERNWNESRARILDLMDCHGLRGTVGFELSSLDRAGGAL